MNSENPRALVFGTYAILWKFGNEKLISVLKNDKFAPESLSETELKKHDKWESPIRTRIC